MKKLTITVIIAAVSIFNNVNAQLSKELISKEEQLYRPNYHFTPQANWMNDPNGLYYLDGVYHLFFQYHPEGNKWGPMHWGHATSEDLVKWNEQEIALFPDELGYIFSGSAIVDKNNTSGFGDGKNVPVIAFYTYHDPIKEKENKVDVESQALAYSLDNGKTWTKYKDNPIIKNSGVRDFRDPKVIRDEVHQQWIMSLAVHDKTEFYSSKNLKDWELLSEFGKGLGAHDGVWECPDFFPIKIDGSNETKWVLIQNLNPGGPHGGSGVQYFVGDFDGKSFKTDALFTKQLAKEKAVWLDWGMDNYASVSFDNVPNNKRVIIGWMSNWLYAQEVPTERWRSSNTIAREVTLVKSADGYILKNIPVAQLAKYQGEKISKNIKIKSSQTIFKKNEIDLTKAVIDLDFKKMTSGVYKFTLSNSLGEKLTFGIDNKEKSLFIDRRKSGKITFGEKFAEKVTKAPLSKSLTKGEFKILLDKTSIEIFYNDGEKVITEIFFPNESYNQLSLHTDTKGSSVKVNAYQLNLN